jgi:protein ImuA
MSAETGLRSRGQRSEHHLVIARLREEIRRLERRPGRREGVLPCGRSEIDALLPGGGFRRGALTELAGGPASGKTAVALALFTALGEEDLAAFIDGTGELYPPGAAALGVDLARLLVVRPGGARGGDPGLTALWAAEALLASGAFAVVAIDAPVVRAVRGADAAARRLQAAAEQGGAIGLWLAQRDGGGLRVPAEVRPELEAEEGGIVGRRQSGWPAQGEGVPRPPRSPRELDCFDAA